MNVERLRRVVEVLRGVPDAAFDLETWWRTNCQTVGCAVGHYIRATPECGLTLKPVWGGSPIHQVTSGALDDWEAVVDHFDLSENDASDLFERWHYDGAPTRAVVIARIEAFIASNGTVSEPVTAEALS